MGLGADIGSTLKAVKGRINPIIVLKFASDEEGNDVCGIEHLYGMILSEGLGY